MSRYFDWKVTDEILRETYMYGQLHVRGEDTNQFGTPLTVSLSQGFDRWVAERDSEVAETAKAEVLKSIIHRVDLDSIANEWSYNGKEHNLHWAAGNGASTVLNMIYDELHKYENVKKGENE